MVEAFIESIPDYVWLMAPMLYCALAFVTAFVPTRYGLTIIFLAVIGIIIGLIATVITSIWLNEIVTSILNVEIYANQSEGELSPVGAIFFITFLIGAMAGYFSLGVGILSLTKYTVDEYVDYRRNL